MGANGWLFSKQQDFAEEINRNTDNILNKFKDKQSNKIEQSVRDKVYEWHGNIGKDRYDVDKTLSSFIRMSKNIAKDISKKVGFKVSDKQLREVLPFLRERTGVPEELGRKG